MKIITFLTILCILSITLLTIYAFTQEKKQMETQHVPQYSEYVFLKKKLKKDYKNDEIVSLFIYESEQWLNSLIHYTKWRLCIMFSYIGSLFLTLILVYFNGNYMDNYIFFVNFLLIFIFIFFTTYVSFNFFSRHTIIPVIDLRKEE